MPIGSHSRRATLILSSLRLIAFYPSSEWPPLRSPNHTQDRVAQSSLNFWLCLVSWLTDSASYSETCCESTKARGSYPGLDSFYLGIPFPCSTLRTGPRSALSCLIYLLHLCQIQLSLFHHPQNPSLALHSLSWPLRKYPWACILFRFSNLWEVCFLYSISVSFECLLPCLILEDFPCWFVS